MDDYDATDAFAPNRVLDSFAMLLVLRDDPNPLRPRDGWNALGATPTVDVIKQRILDADLGPAAPPVEYPSRPEFDRTAVFLARVGIPATQASAGDTPVVDLTLPIAIDNESRLFVYPATLQSRWTGLTSGEV
jgi:hypothetical protein